MNKRYDVEVSVVGADDIHRAVRHVERYSTERRHGRRGKSFVVTEFETHENVYRDIKYIDLINHDEKRGVACGLSCSRISEISERDNIFSELTFSVLLFVY